MTDRTAPALVPGKLPNDLLARLLAGAVGAPDVRVGPRIGEDACVLAVPEGALVAAADPITLTGADVGRFAVILNANDVAVMGVRPQWFLATVLLPPGTTEADVVELFAQMQRALAEVGATLVGGHTEVTSAVRQPVVAGQMLGVAPAGRYVTTSGARPGDVVVQLGAVPVEGAAVLALECAPRLDALPAGVRTAAARALDEPGISVVDAAVTAAELGASALHDPTEGGLASGLHELAVAAGVGVHVDAARIAWFEPGRAVCEALGADPWATLASGCALATFAPGIADDAVARLRDRGHLVAVIGTAARGEGVHDITGAPVPWPTRDEVARLLG